MGGVVSSEDESRKRDEEDESEDEDSIDEDSDDSGDSSEDDSDEEESEDDSESLLDGELVEEVDSNTDTSFFGESDTSDSSDDDSEDEEEEVRQEVIITENMMVGFGLPLLEIKAKVGAGYIKRFELTAGSRSVAGEKQISLYKELCGWFSTEFLPGGGALNVIRVAQWMLPLPKATSIVGAIGTDENGKRVSEACTAAGIVPMFYEQETDITGCVAKLSVDAGPAGSTVTQITHLSAGNAYSKQRHLDLEQNWDRVKEAEYFFIPGLFLTVCPETTLAVGEMSSEKGKTFALTLGNPQLCRLYKDTQLAVLRYVDFLFSNAETALSFAQENDFETTDLAEIARKMCLLPKVNSNKPRVVVITQGVGPTVVARGYDEVHEFEVDEIENKDGPAGLGDFFIGGFLGQLVQGHGLERCVEGGHFAVQELLQHGNKLSGECPFE
ncbi:unnamed protein product [Oikopleura dioica]|uniref:adenosine kinase n=1 Tax=Oikopleura dioica TaxID=34765 RepID=E4XRJ5_OIKDI|nr:unnamed protein product [Oikopleura dioica]